MRHSDVFLVNLESLRPDRPLHFKMYHNVYHVINSGETIGEFPQMVGGGRFKLASKRHTNSAIWLRRRLSKYAGTNSNAQSALIFPCI